MRTGDAGDRAFVHELGLRSASTSVSNVRATEHAEVLGAFDKLLAFVWTRDHDLLVAESEGERIGFLLLLYDIPDEVSNTPQAFVAYTAVEPAHWRRGAGRALLKEGERRARERGMQYVSLMVTETNDAARALYARAGYLTERRMLTKPV